MFTVWQLLADFRAGRTISLVKSHTTLCFASYSAWQTMITRSHADITLLWCRIQSSSGIENNKFVYGLQNWFVFVAAFIPDYTTLLRINDCGILQEFWVTSFLDFIQKVTFRESSTSEPQAPHRRHSQRNLQSLIMSNLHSWSQIQSN